MMTNQLISSRIRSATLNDLKVLLALSRRTFIQSSGPRNTEANMNTYMNEAFSEAQLMNELHDKASIFFLLEYGTEVVGYAKLRTSKKQAALGDKAAIEIQRLYLLEEYTGKGIGKALMQKCLDKAISLGYQVVWLGVWEHNPRAIAFYQACGFEVFSSYIFQFGDEAQTDLLMKKTL